MITEKCFPKTISFLNKPKNITKCFLQMVLAQTHCRQKATRAKTECCLPLYFLPAASFSEMRLKKTEYRENMLNTVFGIIKTFSRKIKDVMAVTDFAECTAAA